MMEATTLAIACSPDEHCLYRHVWVTSTSGLSPQRLRKQLRLLREPRGINNQVHESFMSTPVYCVHWDCLRHACQEHGYPAFICSLGGCTQDASNDHISDILRVNTSLVKGCLEQRGQHVVRRRAGQASAASLHCSAGGMPMSKRMRGNYLSSNTGDYQDASGAPCMLLSAAMRPRQRRPALEPGARTQRSHQLNRDLPALASAVSIAEFEQAEESIACNSHVI